MTYIPKSGTTRHRILEIIRDKGPQSLLELAPQFKVRREFIDEALEYMEVHGAIEAVNGRYDLTERMKRYFAMADVQPAEYTGEKAGPRTFVVNRPLKALPWSRHLDKIRVGMSFLNGSSSFVNGVR